MNLAAITGLELERLRALKSSAYVEGRIAGYLRGLSVAALPGCPDSDDMVDARAAIRDWLRNVPADTTPYGTGFRKSMRNIYASLFNMVYEPVLTLTPISQAQHRLIGVLSKRYDVQFYGLSGLDANIWIKEIDNGKDQRPAGGEGCQS